MSNSKMQLAAASKPSLTASPEAVAALSESKPSLAAQFFSKYAHTFVTENFEALFTAQ